MEQQEAPEDQDSSLLTSSIEMRLPQNGYFVFISRLASILGPVLAAFAAWLFMTAWGDLRTSIEELRAAGEQNKIDVAVIRVQNDDIKRRIGKLEDKKKIDD